MTRIKDLPTFETLDSANWVAVDTNSEETESGKASVEVLSSYLSANLPFVQSVNQSTGISVNNSDPNNPLVGLSQSSQDALNLATTAVQPHILGGLAYQDQITVPDIDATGTPTPSSALFGDGVWRTIPGGGNMLSSIYDPQNISNDAFDLANHTGEVPPSSVNELGLTRRLSARVGGLFDTVADLIADTTLTYSNVSEGDIIEAQGFRYEVAASGASDEHLATAGGVKLYVLRSKRGEYIFDAFGPVADGVTADTTLFKKAADVASDAAAFLTLTEGQSYAVGATTLAADLRLRGSGTIVLIGNLTLPDDAKVCVCRDVKWNASDNVGLVHPSSGDVMDLVRLERNELTGGRGFWFRGGAKIVRTKNNAIRDLVANNGQTLNGIVIGQDSVDVSDLIGDVVMVGDSVVGGINSSDVETHGFLVYANTVRAFGLHVEGVFSSGHTADEGIYFKANRLICNSPVVTNTGSGSDGMITLKGQPKGSITQPEGYDCILANPIVTWDADDTSLPIGILIATNTSQVTAPMLSGCYIATSVADTVIIEGGITSIDVDGVTPALCQVQDTTRTRFIGHTFKATYRNYNANTTRAGLVRGVTNTPSVSFENCNVSVSYPDLTTGGGNACSAFQFWCDQSSLKASFIGGEINVFAPIIASQARLSALFASGSENLDLILDGVHSNVSLLKNSSTGITELEIDNNKSPMISLASGNAAVSNSPEFRANNIGAGAINRLNLRTAPLKGEKGKIASSSFEIDVRPISATWADGGTADRRLAAGGFVSLECFENGVWHVTSQAGAFS